MAIVLVMAGRAFARGLTRRTARFRQRTLIVGAGATGQLVARKLIKHPEYGLDVIGFVDERPLGIRSDVDRVEVIGTLDDLPRLVSEQDAERVIVAFSNEDELRTLDAVRDLAQLHVQVDVVPRLYEVVGPRVDVHTLEGLPLVGLPPPRLPRSSRLLKRSVDVVGASLGLMLTAPLFGFIALRVWLDSSGPVLFRQPRLGLNMKEFNALKFRTMKLGTSDAQHREYIREIRSAASTAATNGVYKLDRSDAVTAVGRWLRKTSLDELPQLVNVLRGEMSLVGPRPCLPYEIEVFQPHHFERFNVPAGITGLWQVTARSHSTFGEALDMDVAYVRGWSFGLDLRLIFRTPLALLRQRQATA
jgi:exopolysaccharide biosynthesis polyprenyl glycosylphosphotransferase